MTDPFCRYIPDDPAESFLIPDSVASHLKFGDVAVVEQIMAAAKAELRARSSRPEADLTDHRLTFAVSRLDGIDPSGLRGVIPGPYLSTGQQRDVVFILRRGGLPGTCDVVRSGGVYHCVSNVELNLADASTRDRCARWLAARRRHPSMATAPAWRMQLAQDTPEGPVYTVWRLSSGTTHTDYSGGLYEDLSHLLGGLPDGSDRRDALALGIALRSELR